MRVGTDFVHVILTRFNIATPGRESRIRDRPGWLASRFDLFERYCLPSLAAQTNPDFHWIVYFDEGAPEPVRARIKTCRRICDFHPYFTPIFPGERWGISVRGVLAAAGLRAPWLLSTSVDNDDGLAVDFVSRLQAAVEAAPMRRSFFNLTNGFVFDGRRAYAHVHPSNAFVNLFEPWDHARTAPSYQHMHISEYGPVIQVDGPGAWLQVVHGGNVSNKIRGRRVSVDDLAGRFAASIYLGVPGSKMGIAAENLTLTPLRGARDRAIGLVRRLGWHG